MTRARLLPILAAALLFLSVVHTHPVSTSGSPCAVCVHHRSIVVDTVSSICHPTVWTPIECSVHVARVESDSVTAITRGPPLAA